MENKIVTELYDNNKKEICDKETNLDLMDIAILCKLSYIIYCTQKYIPIPEECILFTKVQDTIIYFETQYSDAIASITKDMKTLIITFSAFDLELFTNKFGKEQIIPKITSIDDDDKIKFNKEAFNQFNEMRETVMEVIADFKNNKGENIVLSGHSTGGTIASIFGYYLKKINLFESLNIITIGTPPFTNKYGAEWFEENTNYIRIEYCNDIIPNLWLKTYDGARTTEYFNINTSHIYILKNKLYINPSFKKANKFSRFKKKVICIFKSFVKSSKIEVCKDEFEVYSKKTSFYYMKILEKNSIYNYIKRLKNIEY
jgi:hypothetical protein